MLISGFIVLGPIVKAPELKYLYVLIGAFVGLVVYVPFVYYKKTLIGMGMLFPFH